MFGTSYLLAMTIVGSALLVGGLLSVALGRLPAIARSRFDLSARGEAGLKGAFLGALSCALFVGGLMTDQWGVPDALITGSLLAGFSLACLGVSRNSYGALFAGTVLGAATGLLHTATVVAMPMAFTGLGVAPAATNLGFIFVALGGLILPFLVVALVRKFAFRNGLLILALLAIVPACGVALAGGSADPAPHRGADLSRLFADFYFWLALAAVVCFYGLETTSLRWAPRFLDEVQLKPRSRLVLWIFFWTLFLGARLAATTVHSIPGFVWLALILALVVSALLGNMIGMYHTGAGATSFLILGGCLGPIFPTLSGLVLVLFPTQPAVALGLLCAAGTLGRLLVGPLTDRLLAVGRVRQAMGFSMVLGLVVLFPPLIWLIIPWK